MSNLADLLPAGGGQNNTDFVADGTISSGAPVVLTAAGKAAPISSTTATEAVGTEAVYYNSTMYQTSTAFDSTNNRAIFVYKNQGTPFYVRCVIGTVNGTGAMTYGTEVVLNSTTNSYYPVVVFDSNAGKAVVFYYEGSSLIARVGTVDPSDNSISFGSPVTVAAVSASAYVLAACFDTTNNQILVIFPDNVDSSSKGRVVTVNGTSLTLGSESGIGGASDGWYALTYDSGSNNIIFAFQDYSNSYYASCMVGSISSSAPSFPGLVYAFDSSGISGDIGCSYDSTANKTVFVWRDGGQSNRGKAIVGTVTGATSITFGAEVDVNSGRADYLKPIYDPIANKTIVLYSDYNYPAVNRFYGRLVVGTISGTNLTFASPTIDFHADATKYITGAYDSTSNVILISYQDNGNADKGTAKIFRPDSTQTNLTSTNLLGIASDAISDTATGTINTWGSRNEAAVPALATGSTTDLTGKTQSPYPVLTYDTTNSKFVAFFQDANNSQYGTAVVITVSGSTVSFGTPVVFESAATYAPDAVYNAAADQHMVVYPDYGNSQQATAVVGSVSGTSITFGTPAIYDTGTANVNASVGYNATLGKYLAAATPTSYAADDLKIYVLSVSGTTITAGSGVTVGSGKRYPNIVANDSASDFVLTNNTGNNQAEAHLISVSGTTPTVEDTEALSAVINYSYPHTGLVFLENNKFLSVYYDQGTENTYARTITVSGSSLSLGTESSAFNTNPGNQTMINGKYPLFFVSTTEAYLYYQDDATDYLRYVPITVSGTTATSGTEVTYYSTAVAYEGFLYNSSSKQSVSFFQESSQTKGLAQNGALVIGTDYYVQTDGSLSTDTGGQLIGQAITATQINIKDYTG